MSVAKSAVAHRSIPGPYLAMWLIAATGALTYLGVLSARPDALHASSTPKSLPASRDLESAAAQLKSENADLRKTLAAAEQSLVTAKADAAVRQERESALAARIAALEERTTRPVAAEAAPAPLAALAATVAAAAPPAPAPKLAAPSRAAEQRAARLAAATQPASAAPQAISEAVAAPPGAPRPSVINAAAIPAAAAPTAPIATGSIPPAPVNFGPAIVRPAAGPAAINLGAGPSLDALRLSWSLLNDRHGTVLKNLQPKYAAPTGDGQAYQLIAGPVASALEAQRVCEQLKARRVPCSVASFAGEGL